MDLSLTLCYFLFRYFLPLTLGAAVVFRQNIFSSLYLILLFVAPILPSLTADNLLKGINGIYLKTIIVLCSVINSAHIIFQVFLVIWTNYSTAFDYCSEIGQIYNLIGLHRYNKLSVFNILRLCCLDFVVLIITSLIYVFCIRTYTCKVVKEPPKDNQNKNEAKRIERERRLTEAGFSIESLSSKQQPQTNKKRQKREKAERFGYYITEFVFCILLCVSAVLEPSLVSAIYFIYFLFIGSWLALNRKFSIGYHYFRIFISIFVGAHFLVIYTYQLLIIRPLIPPDNINARLFGLIQYTDTTCSTARNFHFKSYHFIRFLHPFMLILLYFVSVSLVRLVLISKRYNWDDPLNVASIFAFPTHSFASERTSNGFLGFLLSTNYGKRCSQSQSFINDNVPVANLLACNEKVINGYTIVDETPIQSKEDTRFGHGHKLKLSQSLHVNRTFDKNATDQTPLLGNNHVVSRYNSMSKASPESLNVSHVDEMVNKFESFSNPRSSNSMQTSVPNTPNQLINSSNQQPQENNFSLFVSQMTDMIKRGSYVITLIVMMTWSITYHSWLSFILLLSSCIIWMMPNSRQACLNSSPILVIYAILLLIGQYIYSLNLSDNELPINIGDVSISEIGFRKYGEFSYQPLFIKICYTLFFWITLRQYTEKLQTKVMPTDVPQSLFAPLFNIGTKTNRNQASTSREIIGENSVPVYQSKIFDLMVNFFHQVLIKYWIWVVATMLMIMSLSGSKVVIYRIVYMFLFLTFTLLFQISLKWWRKLIYPFWLIVILYSMIILIAIYTYQFNNFPDYWQDYLKINKELQADLGLVVYDNDAFILFKELLTPTFFIIITIIQVHFVHRDFLEFSNIDDILDRLQMPSSDCSSSSTEQANVSSSKASFENYDIKLDMDLRSQPSQSEVSSVQTVISKRTNPSKVEPRRGTDLGLHSPYSDKSALKDEIKKPNFFLEMKQVFIKCFTRIHAIITKWMIVFWRLLEIHILKFVLLCAVIISIKDISVMNIIFVFLSVFLMVFSKFEQTVCFLLGIWAGLLVLLKMLFQLNIAQQIEWHTNCSNENNGSITEIDNRIYIGFLKTDDIFHYIWEYILLIIILVFRTVILLRQNVYRQSEYGKSCLLPGVVFQNISRTLADKDFKSLIKFCINYTFYKFGVEICLILLTISIGNRGDIFSVLYCIWLLLFVLFNRHQCQKYWAYFVGFLGIIVPYQYLMCLGIPPGLCIEYPWVNTLPRTEKEWYFLPDFQHQLPKNKLYLDFLVLFCACRQLISFRLEKVLAQHAGSNLEAHKDKVVQDVPDFFSFGNSIFDAIKSFFFFCFFWITLAVLFLAGTTRINLFGLGYVLGSFIFLWNGNEFYLKPIKMIFKSWKLIIVYTCLAMFLKSIIQLFVITMLKYNLCWLIQLLGVSYYEKSLMNQSTIDLVSKCTTDEAGLLWDGICFTFLLIQKRIFCSHYFKHLVREIKAQHFLASRGAELIHEIQAQEVSEQEIAEKEVMEKIKQKMDRIKEAQQKMFANKARSIKYHKQDEFDYDISPYSAADETLSNVSVSEDLFSQTLPTVYSPTPSIPTITSPQSATSLQPGYFEVYKVCPIRSIDASLSSATIPSFSFASASENSVSPQSFAINVPHIRERLHTKLLDDQSENSSVFLSSNRTQVSVKHKDNISLVRKQSHSSSVKSGGYYMFEEMDTDVVDLNHKTRGSLIPDPEGNEIKNLAKSKGFTAFCSKIFKGEDLSEAALVSAEATDIGESSKDSAIVSVERPKYHPDMSKPTTMTSVASFSQNTDISNMSSLSSKSQKSSKKLSVIKTDIEPSEHEQAKELQVEPPPQQTYLEKISNGFNFLKKFFESILISATSSLNSVSRDYRFVAKRLSLEKKCLKKVIEFKESEGIEHDFTSDQSWRKSTLAKLSKSTEDDLGAITNSEPKKAIEKWNELENTAVEGDKNLYYVTLDPKYMETSIYVHFLRAIFYAILSRSEVICYITIVINQITSASILSLPLPLFAFLWGSLSVPRPSKSFWVTSITYIEVMVVLKYIFQFNFWPWLNDIINFSPFWWPRLLGIEKKDNYANYDLILLLVLFFHRFMLKSLGLWDLSETEIKAYMTNAELTQKEFQNGENSSKRIKSSKKKLKSKNKVDSKSSIEDEAQYQKTIDSATSGNETSQSSKDASKFETEKVCFYNEDDDDDDESNDLNVVYLMMEAPNRIKQRFYNIVNPVIKFFHNVLYPPYRITHDVYSLMFLCDFINFFILVFGFYAFGSGYSGNADVAKFLEENRIPTGFLITLLIQFAQIIIDRAIYLRKYIKGKLIFQIIIVIFTHMWLFFALPAMTDKSFTDKTNLPPKLWYIFKCIYFLLSAYQIRSGYPTRILGNTFCKKYNLINWYLFKMYMLIPFVYDLRMYMDWIWTDTSLVLDEWSLMEDIFVNLYQRKCELKLDEEFPEPRGKAKKRFFKYLIGGSWVVIIIALIWGPLGLFAFGRAVGEVNPPIGTTIELEIAGYQPLFKMSVTGSALEPISDSRWNKLMTSFNKNAIAQTFINGYDQKDVYIANLNGNSTAVWGISPPSQEILEQDLLSNRTLNMKITYYIVRKKQAKTQDMDTTIYDEYLIELDPTRDIQIRKQLAAMISQTDEQAPAIIPNIFPNYLRVPEKGKPVVVEDLLPKNMKKNKSMNYRNIQILMKKGNYENSSLTSWWEIHDDCHNVQYLDYFFQDLLNSENCQYLPVVLFNDKVFIGLLAFLSGYGIIGIYTTFVFLVSRWVRGLNSESSFKVIYTRMPNVDRVLQLCLDIYLVRESREFELEEDLYAKLIFLYRSPETLIKWTKINEEIQPDTSRDVYRTN